MIPLFKQNGGELLLATRARHLVLTDDGQVCGVGAERDGDEVRIRVVRADLQRKQLDFDLVASYDFDTKEATPVE